MDLSFFMTFDHSMSSESWQKIFTDIFAPSFLSYDARLCVIFKDKYYCSSVADQILCRIQLTTCRVTRILT
jgi:hypothetical protein